MPAEQKHCSRCGNAFACGPETKGTKCWCDQLPYISLAAAADQDCLCPECLSAAFENLNCDHKSDGAGAYPPIETTVRSALALVEGEDYYSEGAAIVFTARYHLRRGYCCENRCRHCPYGLALTKEQDADCER